MPNIKSAKKRVLISESRRLRNAAAKSKMKTTIKAFDAALKEGNQEKAQVALKNAVRILDKTAGAGVIHKNAASRKKSKLNKAYNQLG